AVNLVLHWSAVLLVFRIVRDHLWLGDDALAVAAASALVVALHPLNTEPVDYLSARSALLTTVFSLAAFDATARARPRWAAFLVPLAWGSLLVLLVLGALAWRARRRWPALTFAALWYAVALAAEQTIFPLTEPVNEHRPYLAMLGLGTAAGLGLRGAAHLLARPLRVPATRVVVVLVALVA